MNRKNVIRILMIAILTVFCSIFFLRKEQPSFMQETGFTLSDLEGNQTIESSIEEEWMTKKEFLKLVLQTMMQKANLSYREPKKEEEFAFYVQLAENYGLVTEGSIQHKNANEPITRMEGMEIIALGDMNILQNEVMGVDIMAFDDIETLSEWEVKVLGHLVARGMVPENAYGLLRPSENLTKKEVMQLLAMNAQ